MLFPSLSTYFLLLCFNIRALYPLSPCFQAVVPMSRILFDTQLVARLVQNHYINSEGSVPCSKKSENDRYRICSLSLVLVLKY
jgi:hypothetical protein